MAFCAGFVHSDPHSGNVLVRPHPGRQRTSLSPDILPCSAEQCTERSSVSHVMFTAGEAGRRAACAFAGVPVSRCGAYTRLTAAAGWWYRVLGGCGGYVEPQLVFLDHGRYIVLPDPMRQRYCQLWCSFIANDARTMREVATGIAGTGRSVCRGGAQPVHDSMAVGMPVCLAAVWRSSWVHTARARNS